MRLLFLDFDGVLNSLDWMKRRPSAEDFAREMEISPEHYDHDRLTWGLRSIDPDAVAALNDIVRRSGARVVVSSSWRTMYALPKLEWMLRSRGFEHHLLGATPDTLLVSERGTERHSRGVQILAWMRTMSPEIAPPHPSFQSIVILDDDSDMGDLVPRLFQTDYERGLCAEHVDRIVEMYA